MVLSSPLGWSDQNSIRLIHQAKIAPVIPARDLPRRTRHFTNPETHEMCVHRVATPGPQGGANRAPSRRWIRLAFRIPRSANSVLVVLRYGPSGEDSFKSSV